MGISALVIGHGAIGRRHARILSNMDTIKKVTVLSSQSHLCFDTIHTLDEIAEIDPDYIVIASNTALHFKHLSFLEEMFERKVILVEKPLFEAVHNLAPVKNSVWVAYLLRFHPILKMIKKKISKKKLWNINIFCGSYLPEWRPGRDYRETSSARKDSGGGVLLDLSHELDYLQWLIGPIDLDYVYNGKVSSLEIETDDLLTIDGHSANGVRVHISLNYFTRKPIRQIIIDGENISIQADLVSSQAMVHMDGKFKEYSWKDIGMDQICREEHESVIKNDNSYACTYAEGLETMYLIDQIKDFKQV